jgi:hypothetical protein
LNGRQLFLTCNLIDIKALNISNLKHLSRYFSKKAKFNTKLNVHEMETKRNLNRFHFAYRATDNSTRSLGSADRVFNLINTVKNPAQ